MVEHARGVVENQSIDLANTDNDRERVAERVRGHNEQGDDETEGSPGELFISLEKLG
jgi:hypothetical protein